MIESGTLYVEYNCNGSVETFNIGLEYLKTAANIAVFYTVVATGAEYPLVKDTNYTVDIVADTITTITGNISGLGSVSSPYASTVKLTIKLAAPYTQLTDITSNSNYPPETLEQSWDKNCILTKQNKEKLDRSLALQDSDVGTDMTLPALEDLKNGVLGFDANGLPQAHPGAIPRMYDAGYTYLTNDIIQYDGLFYIALQSTTGNAPAVGAYWGLYNLQNINAWAGATTYAVDAVVAYLGQLYISLQAANLNKNPITETLWWTAWPAGKTNALILADILDDTAMLILEGSQCEVNGVYITVASDTTPSGHSGISAQAEYYCYCTPAGVFSFSETVPTWNITKMGWYNGNNRAFYQLKKAGSGYFWKRKLLEPGTIGIWTWNIPPVDFDTEVSQPVSHGFQFLQILSVNAMIHYDTQIGGVGIFGEVDTYGAFGAVAIDGSEIIVSRVTGGFFDDTGFDDDTITRGYITVVYLELDTI